MESNIIVKNSFLNNPQLMASLQKLVNFDIDPKAAWNIRRLIKVIDQKIDESKSLFTDMRNKYALLDKDGKLTPSDDGALPFKLKEVVEVADFEKDLMVFMETEHEIDRRKININLLDGAKLSASDMSVLEPLLCGLDD